MIAQLHRAAEAFRVGAEASGSVALMEMLDALEQVSAHPAVEANLSGLSESLGGVMAAQSRGDWTGVADLLEYRVLPLLDGMENDSDS